MSGYIKDHRKELDSDIWIMPPLYHRVWQYLKYKVNHDAGEIPMRDGTKFSILPGQHLTSIRTIAKGVSWYEGRVLKEPNPKTIDTILKWLVKRRMILTNADTGNRSYTLITLVNWEVYQHETVSSNAKVTDGKQLMDTNKKNKEELINTAVDNTAEKIDAVFNSFCEIHKKLDIHVKPVDITLMREVIALGVPTTLIIDVMTKIYQNRGGRVHSFSYYKDAIIQAWESEKSITETVAPVVPIHQTESVALGKRRNEREKSRGSTSRSYNEYDALSL